MLVLHKNALTYNILSETCDALKKTLIGVERVGLEVAPKVGIGETTNKNKEIFSSKYLQKKSTATIPILIIMTIKNNIRLCTHKFGIT